MKKISFLQKIKRFVSTHVMWTTIIVIGLVFVAGAIHNHFVPAGTPQYTISRIRTGSIIQTVTATGQISAENQIDIPSQVSGTIQSINVSVGDKVYTGDTIATIDPTNALNTLQSAKISYAKLVEPPKSTDLANSQDSVTQTYSSAFNTISTTFTDLQTIMPLMNNILYNKDTYLSDQNSSYLNTTAQGYRSAAGVNFDSANLQYQNALTKFKSVTHSSATSTTLDMLNDTYALTKNVSSALLKMNATIQYVATYQPDYQKSLASAAATNAQSWLNTINSDVASLLSSQNNINSSENSLQNLLTGTDPLDIQSAKNSLAQAEQTYSNYFIKAPFDGTIGRIPVSAYQQAGSGTTIATIIGNQKIASLSLNEVDAAKVAAGNPVSVTFNAINNFTATGTVEEIDQVGTVSSGVVSYGLKVIISTSDDRIKPGMSVNATITTKKIDNVLIVPSSAIKAQGKNSYVQIFSAAQVSSILSALQTTLNTNGIASSTSKISSTTDATSSLSAFARQNNSSGQYGGNGSGGMSSGINRNVTISSPTIPTNEIVTTGDSDSTNTQILTGLNEGDWIVTKTISSTNQTTTTNTTPSLLSSLGAGGRGGGGGGRPAGQ